MSFQVYYMKLDDEFETSVGFEISTFSFTSYNFTYKITNSMSMVKLCIFPNSIKLRGGE